MSNPVMVNSRVVNQQEQVLYLMHKVWCPGCNDLHTPRTRLPESPADLQQPTWDWDGDMEHPTFSPSYLTWHTEGSLSLFPGPKRCHSFIRNGNWEFLSDCTHVLAGQTVPMIPVPDWVVRDA